MDEFILEDLDNSFLAFTVKDFINYGTFQVESSCMVNDLAGKRKYYLLSPVMACNVYGKDGLIKTPSYIYQAVFSDRHYKIFRTYLPDMRPDNSWGRLEELFEDITTGIKTCAMTLLENNEAVIRSVQENRKIYGTLNYQEYIGKNERDIFITFPVKHINVHPPKNMFQVETGTIAVPYLSEGRGSECGSFELCFIAFQKRNRVEFSKVPDTTVLRKTCRVELYAYNS